MNLVGELVLARNNRADRLNPGSQTLIATTQRLNLITADCRKA